jgi:hypothetical protein
MFKKTKTGETLSLIAQLMVVIKIVFDILH